MKSIGEQLQYSLFDRDGKKQPHDGGKIVHVAQVAHVTFYITEFQATRVLQHGFVLPLEQVEPNATLWKLFSESEKDGLHECRGESYVGPPIGDPPTYDEFYNEFSAYEAATQGLDKEIARFERILEEKRKGMPTRNQLHFLFRHEMPIPVDLTWGQASDLIDEKLAQIGIEKQAKRLEKFNGFVEGDKVSWTFSMLVGTSADSSTYVRKQITKTGLITKLYQAGKQKYAIVESDDGVAHRFQGFDTLQKIDESEVAR